MRYIFLYSILIVVPKLIFAQEKMVLPLPAWLDTSILYEVNIRQYTPEGTFKSFQQHLPRLQKMGVNLLWLMPIYPVSSIKRKGSLGSYYSVASYTEVNPHFGTKMDLKNLIDEAHQRGMRVILDWVPNHTGWEHSWVFSFPEWYTKDPISDTIIHPLQTDWYDVADLNYDQYPMRNEMIRSMLYWIDEFQIDGYRCDVAYKVPVDFWSEVRAALKRRKKPLFLLAESEEAQILNDQLFHANYAWPFMHLCRDIVAGKKNARDLRNLLREDSTMSKHGHHIYFTSNHDENSWKGTEKELLGDAAPMFAAMCFVLNGIPLVYSGQEEPLEKKLRFFDKDTIPFKDYHLQHFYQQLCQLRKSHPSLHLSNAKNIDFTLTTQSPDCVFGMIRQTEEETILCLFNLCNQSVTLEVPHRLADEKYLDWSLGKIQKFKMGSTMELQPWDYKIYIKN